MPSRRLAIDPRARFVPSGLIVAPGELYRFTATGKWRDGGRAPCDANGWACPALHGANRLPGEPFFKLCACVGTDLAQAFAIGTGPVDWIVPATIATLPDRQLYFFANDWPFMYWNNRALYPAEGGPLQVTIKRID
jgi:hypothetical protein